MDPAASAISNLRDTFYMSCCFEFVTGCFCCSGNCSEHSSPKSTRVPKQEYLCDNLVCHHVPCSVSGGSEPHQVPHSHPERHPDKSSHLQNVFSIRVTLAPLERTENNIRCVCFMSLPYLLGLNQQPVFYPPVIVQIV